MKGYRHLTAAQREQILASYQRTRSTKLTAEEVGLPTRRVADAVRYAGLPLTGSTGGACYRHAAEVEQWAAEGLPLSEIARRIGTKHQLVAKYIREHGLARKPFEQKGANNPAWNGGRQTDKHGYILVLQPDHPHANRHGYVREHRLVMEQTLGRHLRPEEVVHHRDGNRANNHPDNLEMFASNREHLAQTLRGQTPRWTPEGRARTLAAHPRRRRPTQNASQSV